MNGVNTQRRTAPRWYVAAVPAGVATWAPPRPTAAPARVPLLASTAVRSTLTGPRQRALLRGRTRGAIYLRCDDGVLLAVLAPGAARLPLGLFCGSTDDWHRLAVVASSGPIRVGGGSVTCGVLTAAAVRWWDPRVVIGRAAAPPADLVAPGELGLPAAVIKALTAAVHSGDAPALHAVAQRLAGLGPGLTPAGDDVLIGVQSVLTCFGHRLSTVLPDAVHGRTTDLSHALLRLAADGAYLGEVGRLLRALAGHGDVAAAGARLAAVGHTSGAALLAGVAIGAATP